MLTTSFRLLTGAALLLTASLATLAGCSSAAGAEGSTPWTPTGDAGTGTSTGTNTGTGTDAGHCTSDSDCNGGQTGTGMVCSSTGSTAGQCIGGCHNNSDCPAGDVCDTQVTPHWECTPASASSSSGSSSGSSSSGSSSGSSSSGSSSGSSSSSSSSSSGSSSGSGTQSLGEKIAALALANVGGSACGTNTLGGSTFETSCTGNGGQPEYWCADFAMWVWSNAGVSNMTDLDAAAASFYTYGQDNSTLSDTPAVGDAAVFDYDNGGIHHVAIVTQVNADGTIETVSGDWNGDNGTEAQFSSTSSVVLNSPAYDSTVGGTPSVMGQTLEGFIAPAP